MGANISVQGLIMSSYPYLTNCYSRRTLILQHHSSSISQIFVILFEWLIFWISLEADLHMRVYICSSLNQPHGADSVIEPPCLSVRHRVQLFSRLTGKSPLPGRDSMAREQREIPGLVWEWLAVTGSWAWWAETNQSKSREIFPVLNWNEMDKKSL